MIKQISINTERVFIPEFDNNKKNDPSDQIKVHYKAITSSIKEDLVRRNVNLTKDSQSGEMVPNVSLQIDMRKTLDKLIVSIENLGYAVNGGEAKKVTTVQALFDADIEVGLYPLIEEIFAFCNDMLNQRVDEKN
jgi:hypothetical protein